MNSPKARRAASPTLVAERISPSLAILVLVLNVQCQTGTLYPTMADIKTLAKIETEQLDALQHTITAQNMIISSEIGATDSRLQSADAEILRELHSLAMDVTRVDALQTTYNTSLNDRITKSEEAASIMSHELDRKATEMLTLTAKMEAIKTGQNQLDASMAKLQAAVEDDNSSLEDKISSANLAIGTKIDRLVERVTTFKDRTSQGSIELEERLRKNIRDTQENRKQEFKNVLYVMTTAAGIGTLAVGIISGIVSLSIYLTFGRRRKSSPQPSSATSVKVNDGAAIAVTTESKTEAGAE